MDRVDVVVIGCGIVGLAAAWRLARRGLSVAAIDRGRCGTGTSAATFAWINATSKTESEAYHRLNAAGLAAYEQLAAEIGAAEIGLRGSGSLQWAAGENHRLAATLRARFETLQAFRYPVEWLDAMAMRRAWPMLALPDGSFGLHAAADRWLEVPRFIEWLAADFIRHGGRLLEGRSVAAIEQDGSERVVAFAPSGEELASRALLLAGSTGTPSLVALAAGDPSLAERFPLRAVPGFLVEIPSNAGAADLDAVLWSPDEDGFHLRPTARGGLLLGADDIDEWVGEGANPSLIARAVAALFERARDWLPKLSRDGLQLAWRIGRRAMPLDGQSIVGPVAAAPGCWVAVTHSGVTLALHMAGLLAEEIVTGKAPDALDEFRPGRFGL